VVAEAVVVADDQTDVELAIDGPRLKARPEHPKRKALMAVARWPAQELPLGIEMPGDALHQGMIHRFRCREWLAKARLRHRHGAEVLEVAIADGAGQHVEKLDMAGLAVNHGEFATERFRKGRYVGYGQR